MTDYVASSGARQAAAAAASITLTGGVSLTSGTRVIFLLENRTNESATVSTTTPTNCNNVTLVAGPTLSVGTTYTTWQYEAVSTGGIPSVQFDMSEGTLNLEGETIACDDAGGTPNILASATIYNSAGATENAPSGGAPIVACPGPGLLVGLFGLNVFQGTDPSLGTGETNRIPSAGGNGRTFAFTQAVAGAGNENFEPTIVSASRMILYQVLYGVVSAASPRQGMLMGVG